MLVILSRFYVSFFLFISTHYELGDFSRHDGKTEVFPISLLLLAVLSVRNATVAHGIQSFSWTYQFLLNSLDLSARLCRSLHVFPFLSNSYALLFTYLFIALTAVGACPQGAYRFYSD